MAARLAALGRTDASKVSALRDALSAEPKAATLSDMELSVWLRASDGIVPRAAARWREAQACLAGFGALSIKDVAPFLRTPSPDRSYPDGCSFLLEDMKGGVARDKLGRPIIALIGMLHGSASEMQRQMAYSMSRSALYTHPGLPPHAECAVIDIVPREKGAPPTFRFPDKSVRTLFDLQSRVYPGALCTTSHFCGLPRVIAWSFKLVKPFMSRDVYEAMVLSPSFASLPKAIDPENMLTRWGGTLDFDIDEYVEWRAREEGVPATAIPGRGCGRAFDAKAAASAASAASAAVDAGAQGVGTSDGASAAGRAQATAGLHAAGQTAAATGGAGVATLGISSLALSTATPSPLKMGEVSKRGSGSGLFSTTRWKRKLLALTDAGLVYFDDVELHESNTSSRLLRLAGTSAVAERRDARSGYAAALRSGARCPPAQFALVTEAREFLFGLETEAEADAWVAALRAQIGARAAAFEALGAEVEVEAGGAVRARRPGP